MTTKSFSVALLAATVSAIGQVAEASTAIHIDSALADSAAVDSIAARIAHRAPAQALGASALAISKMMRVDGELMTMDDGVNVSEILQIAAKSDDQQGGSSAWSCYTNCYTNCHGACHGSRSWR